LALGDVVHQLHDGLDPLLVLNRVASRHSLSQLLYLSVEKLPLFDGLRGLGPREADDPSNPLRNGLFAGNDKVPDVPLRTKWVPPQNSTEVVVAPGPGVASSSSTGIPNGNHPHGVGVGLVKNCSKPLDGLGFR